MARDDLLSSHLGRACILPLPSKLLLFSFLAGSLISDLSLTFAFLSGQSQTASGHAYRDAFTRCTSLKPGWPECLNPGKQATPTRG